jgi:hypothetical protein
MHKLSTATNLPTAALWSLVKHGTIDVQSTMGGGIVPGVGRG